MSKLYLNMHGLCRYLVAFCLVRILVPAMSMLMCLSFKLVQFRDHFIHMLCGVIQLYRKKSKLNEEMTSLKHNLNIS